MAAKTIFITSQEHKIKSTAMAAPITMLFPLAYVLVVLKAPVIGLAPPGPPEMSINNPPIIINSIARGVITSIKTKSKILLSVTKKSEISHRHVTSWPHETSEVAYPGHELAYAIAENKNNIDNEITDKVTNIKITFFIIIN